MFTIDAHLDLSMNALEWNRDLRRPIAEIQGVLRHTSSSEANVESTKSKAIPSPLAMIDCDCDCLPRWDH